MDKPRSYGIDIVKGTIRHVEEMLGFDSHRMLLRMALIESEFGKDPQTFNRNFVDRTGIHSIGIWQITDTALDETKNNANLRDYRKQINKEFDIQWRSVSMDDMEKPLHCCLAAYLYIKFAEKAWPEEAKVGWPSKLADQAKKWKHHFNRNYSGGLSIEGFVKRCEECGI